MALKFYTSVAKGLELKVKVFWANSCVLEVTEENWLWGPFYPPPPYPE